MLGLGEYNTGAEERFGVGVEDGIAMGLRDGDLVGAAVGRHGGLVRTSGDELELVWGYLMVLSLERLAVGLGDGKVDGVSVGVGVGLHSRRNNSRSSIWIESLRWR